MNDLLIVGCGFLGRRIARVAARNDPDRVIRGTSRSSEGADRLRSEGITPVIADVTDTLAINRIPTSSRIVYCVGYDRSSGTPMRGVHATGIGRLLDRLERETWAGRIVYTSSTGVYGQDGGEWVDEDSPAEPSSASGEACLEAETLLAKRTGLGPWTSGVIRLAGLYGPGRIIQKAALERGEPVQGDPDRWLNLIHVDDAAHAVLALLDRPAHRSLYVASDDRPSRRREYYESLASRLGVPAPVFEPAGGDGGRSGREASNKRIRNDRMKRDLVPVLSYPDATAGLAGSLS